MGLLFFDDNTAYINDTWSAPYGKDKDYDVDISTVGLVAVVPPDTPWRRLSDVEREAILSGAPFNPVNLSTKDFANPRRRRGD